jgi:uncharacterized protein (TIGR03000 family)
MFRRIFALPALALFATLLAPQLASAQMGQGFDLYRWSGHWGSEYRNGSYYPDSSFVTTPAADYTTFYGPAQDYTSFYAPQPAYRIPEGAALIQMEVPANAEVWFSGDETAQRGEFRSFVTPPLEAGRNYVYRVRVRWTDQNGETVERTQRVPVRPGDRLNLRF